MRIYRLHFTADDELKAENMDEAWDIFRERAEERFYGPIKEHIEEGEEIEVPEEEE